MTCEMPASLRRLPSSPAAPPLEDDDLLAEILLRLPPLPSSLPRASAVSKRWRSLASDPRFCSRFRAHHRRNPPLVGCFIRDFHQVCFQPALGGPNRVPEGRFSFPNAARDEFLLLGCRHGLVLALMFRSSRKHLLMWDPITGDQHRLDIPPGFDTEIDSISAAVLRPAGDIHHFQVVLVGNNGMPSAKAAASVYSSETGVWCNPITAKLPFKAPMSDLPTLLFSDKPAVMAGDSIYWRLVGDFVGILEFDLEKQCLSVIHLPKREISGPGNGDTWDILTKGGALCFFFHAELWKMKKGFDGVASWALERTIELDKLLPLNSVRRERLYLFILGFAEESNVVLVWTPIGIFTVQLESLQFKKLFESTFEYKYYPFEGVYTVDTGIGGGQHGAELLHNTKDDFSG